MYNLIADTPFAGLNTSLGGVTLREAHGFEIISVAITNGAERKFAARIKKQCKAKTPDPGTWTETNNGRLLWTGQNQYFLFQEGNDARADETISAMLGGDTFCTLQTDGWAALDISGDTVHDILERFIPLDLRSQTPGFGARTSAHHMAVIILKTGPVAYQLLTPRSSSSSFLEALEGVIQRQQI